MIARAAGVHLLIWAAALLFCNVQSLIAQPVAFNYFYDDTGQLFRVLDSTGTLVEYDYDPVGNIIQIRRSTVPATQLTIFNVTPNSAPAGTTITIQGQNFSSVATNDIVMINGIAATLLSASATTLVIQLPVGATSGTLTVTVGGNTATWGTVNVVPVPVILSLSPPGARKNTTATVTVNGQYLTGATFAFQGFIPGVTTSPGSITVLSNTGTVATLSIVLGSAEGQYAIVASTQVNSSAITSGSMFVVEPTGGATAVSIPASVLNTYNNWTAVESLPAGHNAATSLNTSVLNTYNNWTTVESLPAGHNAATSLNASVLNTYNNWTTVESLPPGHNVATSLNASVLNTQWNPALQYTLPTGGNSFQSLAVAVCNVAEGCTYSVQQSLSLRPPAVTGEVSAKSGRDSHPIGPLQLQPVESLDSIVEGRTLLLTAQEMEPDKASTVDFEVNGTRIGTVTEAPYTLLFTVPSGVGELTFRAIVHSSGSIERVSRLVQVPVVSDPGGPIEIPKLAPEAKGSLFGNGLKAEFFEFTGTLVGLPSLKDLQAKRASYVTAINQPNPKAVFGDDPLGAHMQNDFAIRYSGELWAETGGSYRLWLTTRSVARLRVDGKIAGETSFTTGDPAGQMIETDLARGWHRIEIEYALAVGYESLLLEWQQLGGRREVVGPEVLRTELMDVAPDRVPLKFDSVWIRIRQGDAVREIPVRVAQ